MAAARCWIWGPTTSRPRQSARDPWRASPALRPCCARPAPSPASPRPGRKIPVEVPTHVAGTLQFVSGAVVSIAMSFDVPKHQHLPLELYGTEGAMIIPDPNFSAGRSNAPRPAASGRASRDPPCLCGRQLPHPGRRRHGPGHSARIGPTARAARSPITCLRSWKPSSAPPQAASSSPSRAGVERPAPMPHSRTVRRQTDRQRHARSIDRLGWLGRA